MVTALALLTGRTATGQLDRLKQVAGSLEELQVRYDFTELRLDPTADLRGIRRVVGTDGFSLVAKLDGKEFILRCQSCVVWLDPKFRVAGKGRVKRSEPRPFYDDVGERTGFIDLRAILGIYAEGDVFIQFDNQVLRAERIYFDPALNRIVVVHGYVSSLMTRRRGSAPVPFVLRADELRLYVRRVGNDPKNLRRSLEKIRAKNVSVTSCSFGIPHYHIHASDIRVDPYEDEHAELTVTDATLNIRETPVFYLPYLWGRSSFVEYFPLQSISGGSSGRFGTYVYTRWGDDILLRDRNGKKRKWGDWTLNLDSRTRRGPGAGLTIDYDWDNYFGLVTGYYINDDGTDKGRGDDFQPPHEDRGRFRAFHRQRLPLDLQLDVEGAWVSDRNFLYEYFEGEARNGKVQENYARVMRDHENLSGRLIYRPRINDFYTRTQYLPQFSGEVFSQPLIPGGFLGTNLYVDSRASATHGGIAYDEALSIPDRRLNRGDASMTFELPFQLGPLHFAPNFTGRYTGWSESAQDADKIGRDAWAVGARVHTQVWRGYRDALFGMDLRHVVEPQVLYTNTFQSSREPRELVIMDETELLQEFEAITVRFNQRFQVKPGRQVIDVLEWDNAMVFYPDADRDNNGHTEGPWISRLKAGVAPFVLLADSVYDFNKDEFAVANVGIIGALGRIPGIRKSALIGYVGHRFAKRISDVFTGNLRARLGEKWTVESFFQYDYRKDRVMNQRYVIGRNFHRFRLELEFYSRGGDDTGFRFAFAPVEFFQDLKRTRQRYAEGVFLGDY